MRTHSPGMNAQCFCPKLSKSQWTCEHFGFLSSSRKALYSQEHIRSLASTMTPLSLFEYLPSETSNSQSLILSKAFTTQLTIYNN